MVWSILFVAVIVGAAGEVARGNEPFWTEEAQLYPMLPIAVTTSQNEVCRSDSELLVQHLRKQSLWAMTMWDSSAKASVGVLYGDIFQLGNFDECLQVESPIKTQFCVAQVSANVPEEHMNPENPYSLRADPLSNVWAKIRGSRIDPSKVPRDAINWGLCVPASCSSEELERGIDTYLREGATSQNDTVYNVRITPDFCTAADEVDDVTAGEITFWLFTLLLVILTVTSTIADCIHADSTKDFKCHQLWKAFSVKRNISKLTGHPEESSGDNQMNVLHGIKAVSIIAIVLGHRIGISLSLSSSNFQEIEEHLRTGRALFFVHTDLVVDTFFFVSGLLACFFLMKVFTVRTVNPLLAILVRLMRLAPAYFFIIWYQATAANRMGSGPLWKAMAKEENRFCAENWWANVLFLSNYIKPKEMCMTHSWYIPCDFHFFILATWLVILLVRHTKIGYVVLAVLTLISAVIPAVVTYINEIQPMIIFFHDFLSMPRDNESFYVLYVKSHNRATVYLIGMSIGYFLHMHKDSVKRVSKKLAVSSFFVWLLLMFAPMVYGSLYYNSERPYNAIEAAVFCSARRISWAIGFSIFILAHRFGTIPVISKALSSRPAIFVSNITYGIYLLHFNLISADIFQTRSSTPFRIGSVLMEGVGDLLISSFLAIILFLTLEVPCKRILREFLLAKKIQTVEKSKIKLEEAANNNNMCESVTVESCSSSNAVS